MNPSVEEVADEGLKTPHQAQANGNGNPLSWVEVISRHESVLSSHLDLLNSVKVHVGDGDAVRIVSSMVEKTNRLVMQFNVVKKQMMNKTNPFANLPNSPSSHPHGSRSTPGHQSDTKPPNSAMKRARPDQNTVNPDPEAPEHSTVSISKRKRTDRSIPGADEDVKNVTPVSMETEDISEEVNRRLKIKEEMRKKKDSKPEKRKRDSLASNESTSPRGTVKPKAKRVKVKSADEENKEGAENYAKKRESDRSNSEDRRGLKRIKTGSLSTKA